MHSGMQNRGNTTGEKNLTLSGLVSLAGSWIFTQLHLNTLVNSKSRKWTPDTSLQQTRKKTAVSRCKIRNFPNLSLLLQILCPVNFLSWKHFLQPLKFVPIMQKDPTSLKVSQSNLGSMNNLNVSFQPSALDMVLQ